MMKKMNCLTNARMAGYGWVLLFCLAGCTVDETDNLHSDSSLAPVGDDRYKDYGENPFLSTADYPVSTFSVDADGASYANTRRSILQGNTVLPASVRVEEFINYFTYDYPQPDPQENVSIQTELMTCPWEEQHHLMRIGLKGRYIPEEELPASNFVLLIDVSGSMNFPDKLELLKKGFVRMVDALRPIDRVAIVTYAGTAGVSLPSTPCSQKQKIKDELAKLMTKGATAGRAGIEKAYSVAMENYIVGGNNRVILATDGDFNVGVSSTDKLVRIIREKRNSGIYLTVLGVGRGRLNDEMMEQLANNGDGNYEYVSDETQLEKIFVEEKLKFYTVAKDGKLQLHFNPQRVKSYRLIGYENRLLNEEQFDDDREDAGEIGVGQTITALYEVVLQEGEGAEWARLDVRYKKDMQAVSRLISHVISDSPVSVDEASGETRFAAAVAGAGMIFKKSQYRGTLTWEQVKGLAAGATAYDPGGHRQDFRNLLQQLHPQLHPDQW